MFKKEDLRKFDLFTNVEYSSISEFCTISYYSKDSIVFYYGDKSEKLSFLVSGSCSHLVESRDNIINIFESLPGDMLGDIENFNCDSIYYNSTVSTVSDSIILEINFYEFKKIFDNKMLISFLNLINIKNKKLKESINILLMDSMSKICYLIDNKIDYLNENKHFKIANSIGISPETMSRIIKKLIISKIIKKVNNKIIVIDCDKLKKYYS